MPFHVSRWESALLITLANVSLYHVSVASHARAVDSGSTGKQTALLFLIHCAHPRVQYLAMLPVHWVFQKEKSQAWDFAAWPLLMQKVTGLAHFAFCF